MSLMGLDIGTSGCKAAAFDAGGHLLASDYRGYEAVYPALGLAELDVEEIWQAVRRVICTTSAAVQARDPVEAVGISTLGDSLTLLDDAGRPLTRTVLGAADRRAMAQALWLQERCGRDRLFALTGAPLHAFCVIPKILWFREHKPDLFKRAAKFAGLQEIVHMRLGLPPAMDHSLAGRTMLLDIHSLTPAKRLYAEAGLDASKFFPLSTAAKVVGVLGREAADLGLRQGVSVVTGGFDQSCCALGAGVVREGEAALTVGTLEAITPVFHDLSLGPELLSGNHGCIPGLVSGYYTSLAYVTTSGSAIKWCHEHLCCPETGLDELVARLSDGPSTLYALPYFAGSGTPWLDIAQSGMIFGLKLDTDSSQIMKAILEGISYEIRLNVDSFRRASIPIKLLRATGGGARSDPWMQMKADIVGLPIERNLVTEAGCLGAAFLAGLGVGRYSALDDITPLVAVDRVFEPHPASARSYEAPYATYLDIRRRIEGLDLHTMRAEIPGKVPS